MTKSRALLTLAIALMSASAWAQPAPFEAKPQLTFDKLVLAQIDPNDGQPQVVVTVDAYHTQRRNIVNPENRIRLDTADGKMLLLKYPKARTATVEKDAIVAIIPVGKKQVKISANEFRLYRLNGQPLAIADAAEILQAPRPVFLLDDSDAAPPRVSDIYQRALSADCLIAITKKRVRETRTETLPDSLPELPAQPPPQ